MGLRIKQRLVHFKHICPVAFYATFPKLPTRQSQGSNTGKTDAEVDHVKEMLTHSMGHVTPAKHFLQNQSSMIKKNSKKIQQDCCNFDRRVNAVALRQKKNLSIR